MNRMAANAFVRVIAGMVLATATLQASAQALERGYQQPDASRERGRRGHEAPSATPSDPGPSSDDYPQDAVDDRYYSPSDQYDHSLPTSPYDRPQEASSATSYTPPPQSPLDVARASCDALRQQLEQVMRAEMQGGDAAAMQQYAAQRAAIYQQEVRTGCE